MHIKEMPEGDRPREKMLFAGAGALSNSELLALIIRTGTKEKSAVQLAEDVLAYAEVNSGGLGAADVKELASVPGIGLSKACSIAAGMELARRTMSGRVRSPGIKLRDCSDVVDILLADMMYEKRELFMELLLNVKLEVESKEIISIGNIDTAPVHPREVFAPAIKKGAACIIVAHNHPSGDPDPSDDDIMITERLLEVSRVVGIRLLDHVIVGDGRYYSMREHGIIS